MSFTSEAAVMCRIGAPDVFEIQEIDLPWPGNSDEVLVRMQSAGINPADTFFRALGPYIGDTMVRVSSKRWAIVLARLRWVIESVSAMVV
jgi:NADPH:quinone reductase-like Zn-dependent oxidoreductase